MDKAAAYIDEVGGDKNQKIFFMWPYTICDKIGAGGGE